MITTFTAEIFFPPCAIYVHVNNNAANSGAPLSEWTWPMQ